MDTLWIILIVLAVVLVAGGAFFVARRPKGPVEPPAPREVESRSDTGLLERPTAPPVEVVPLPGAPSEAPPVDEAPLVDEAVLEDLVLEEPAVEVAPPPIEVVPVRPNFRDRLAKARSTFSGYVGSVLSRTEITADTWDELEEALIRADVGVGPATDLLDAVRARVKAEAITTPAALIEAVKAEMKARIAAPTELRMADQAPTIWLFVGVNGVGKTTTIGKLGKRLTGEGHSVIMAAGDTFRAAAAEQLGMWADRCGARLVRGNEGGDPSAVVFDAVAAATAAGTDIVLADTAGRLHTKSNLMDELSKVRRVADKGEGTVTEVLLVLDATTGQNGMVQAKQFTQSVEVTGVVLTKLDGSAKGGIVFAIASELGIPVKLVGLGETADDLVDFDAEQFVEALFDQD